MLGHHTHSEVRGPWAGFLVGPPWLEYFQKTSVPRGEGKQYHMVGGVVSHVLLVYTHTSQQCYTFPKKVS